MINGEDKIVAMSQTTPQPPATGPDVPQQACCRRNMNCIIIGAILVGLNLLTLLGLLIWKFAAPPAQYYPPPPAPPAPVGGSNGGGTLE